MQVVEEYIKEETTITIIQAFVEANFLNDMMNISHEIVNNVVQNELRMVIKSVLSEIYFAHITTLFMENLLNQELRQIASDQIVSLKEHQKA